jgi:electron transfer flavoprotein alpha subunit
MKGILIYSESQETALGLLAKARDLVSDQSTLISIALLGRDPEAQADTFISHGADTVYLGVEDSLTHFDSRSYAEALFQIVRKSEANVILIGSTQQGRELAPRLAQKLSAGCLTDALGLSVVDNQLVVQRRSFGGNTVTAKIITSPIQVIAVMPSIYEALSVNSTSGEVIPLSLQFSAPATRLLERQSKETGLVNIENADVLVCIGRGVAQKDDLHLAQALADAVGGMIACTRPISHENHWLAENQMIGISGKVLSPGLYFGVGVSGQIQHTVGILDAKTTVAINKDSNAPIFNIADYGIVGDLYEVLPQLIDLIQGDPT